MTFAELPAEAPVWLCPEVAADMGRAVSLAADEDLSWSAWCGICRFEAARQGRMADLLAAWPLLARQELPRMGQRYERDARGVWMMREDLG